MPLFSTFAWMQRFGTFPLKHKLFAIVFLLSTAFSLLFFGLSSLYSQKKSRLHIGMQGLQAEQELHTLFINLLIQPLNKKPSHQENAPFIETAEDLSLIIQDQINAFYQRLALDAKKSTDLSATSTNQQSPSLQPHNSNSYSRESISLLWHEIQLAHKEGNTEAENTKRNQLVANLQQLMVALAADNALFNSDDQMLSPLVHLLVFSLPSMEAPLAELAFIHNPTEGVATLKPVLEKYIFFTRKLLLFLQTMIRELYTNTEALQMPEETALLELLTQLQIRANEFLAKLEKYTSLPIDQKGYEGSPEAIHTAKSIDDEAISLLNFARNVWDATAVQIQHLLNNRLSTMKNASLLFLTLPLLCCILALCILLLTAIQIVGPLGEMVQNIQRFRSGELQRRSTVRYKDEVGAVAEQLNQLADTYQSLFEQLMEKSRLLARSISQFEELYKQQESASIQQNSTASTLFRTIKMIQEESDSISSSIGEMDAQQESTIQLAKQGREGISALEEIMQGMTRGASSTLEILQMLQQKTVEMNLLREAIAKIAKATQLLSFNAAIEAARIGQQGSGLFIFSREVRSLADMAHDASTRLEQGTQAMQQAVRITVLHVGHFAEQIRSNTSSMQGLHKELGIIMQHMQQQSEALSHIFSSIQTQLHSTENMHQAITDWNLYTDSNMHSMQNWSKTIHTVSKLAQEMHQSVKNNPLLATAYKKKRQITIETGKKEGLFPSLPKK